MAVDKHVFFKDVAKRLAASTLLYKVDSVVHVEDKDDIWFWEQLLLKYRPGRYKFKPATMKREPPAPHRCRNPDALAPGRKSMSPRSPPSVFAWSEFLAAPNAL